VLEPGERTHPFIFVLAGGLIAGTLDILYAYTFWAVKSQVPAQRIFQSVAAGLLGEASFDGGWGTAALGLALHFLIAISIAVVYYQVALRWPPLWQQPLLSGAIYGLMVYGVMNHIVVPLSAAGSGSRDSLWIGLSILVHMLLIGVPCAVFARRAVLARGFAS
jgi:ribose/xylose/arabinose/galactoside ABC-type transport system permease subunit